MHVSAATPSLLAPFNIPPLNSAALPLILLSLTPLHSFPLTPTPRSQIRQRSQAGGRDCRVTRGGAGAGAVGHRWAAASALEQLLVNALEQLLDQCKALVQSLLFLPPFLVSLALDYASLLPLLSPLLTAPLSRGEDRQTDRQRRQTDRQTER